MKLHQLRYSNFGPFKGSQIIEFPDQNGVSVIYGDNNLGKTTILNSVRWLFMDKFLERTGQARDDRELINREAVLEAGDRPVTAKVSAKVTWKGDSYTLTRSVTLEGDKLKPGLHAVRGSNALSGEQASATLQQMIPEEIQQFFLFDAEALNRYEDLLHDPDAGNQLKDAIERILGVPVLKHASQDVGTLIKEHTKVISRLKTLNTRAEAAADDLDVLTQTLDKREKDIADLKKRIETHRNNLRDIEQQMAETEKARNLLADHRNAQQEHERAQGERDAALAQFKEVAPQTWTAVLAPTLNNRLEALRSERSRLRGEQSVFEREQLLVQLRTELHETGECPCCGQLTQVVHARAVSSSQDQSARLADIQTRITSIEQILDPAAIALITERNTILQAQVMKVHDREQELAEAAEQIEGLNDAHLLDLSNQLSNTKSRLRDLREELRTAEKQRDDDKAASNRLATRIAEGGGEAGKAATKKHELLTSLQGLYSSAIDKYQEALKRRVEEEATKVFLSIRSDPDYSGLSINDDYGLSILHKDGELEPHRSAGYEHIVALSLVAALQKCAPAQAPIFMDMPFARLDPEHTLQTLQALPAVADQVVLIVHQGEIEPDEARNTLGTSLVLERQLERQSARHTEICSMGSS